MDPVTLTLGKKYTRKKVVPAYATAMFNPAADVVYDSCYRDITSNLDVLANDVKTDSGHGWLSVDGTDGRKPIVEYLPGGGLQFRSSPSGGVGTSVIPGIALLDGPVFDSTHDRHVYRGVGARYNHTSTNNWSRFIFLHFVDLDNWIAFRSGHYTAHVNICISGNITELASWMSTGSHYPVNSGFRLNADIRAVHANASPSGLVVYASVDTIHNTQVPLPESAISVLETPGRIGIAVGNTTVFYGLRVSTLGGAV